MIDTHAHILSEYYNIEELVKELKSKGVKKVINNATSNEDALEIIELSKKYSNFLIPAVGIHPENADNYNLKDLEELIKNNEVCAIGEIGLDYYWRKDNKEKQKELLIDQIKLANKYKLPVIIHTRDSIQDCLDIVKKYKSRGVIHCFSGSYEMAVEFIKAGYLLGIGGVITFKNSKLGEVVRQIDLRNIVLETDSPYLSPEPFRGKQNNPSNIYYIAKRISEIKGIDVDEVIGKTAKNASDFFDIKA